MKPNEYKTYRELEKTIEEYLQSEKMDAEAANTSLAFRVNQILGYPVTDQVMACIQVMKDDIQKDGTIDYTNLSRYGNLYREHTLAATADSKSSANDIQKQTLDTIRQQLADISFMEARLARMKQELIDLSERLLEEP